ERASFVGDRDKAENTVLVGDRLTERHDAAMESRRPLELPEEHHPPSVVPDDVDVFERVRGGMRHTGDRDRALRIGLEIAQNAAPFAERVRQRPTLEIASDVDLEAKSVSGIEKLRREERLIRLTADERVFIAKMPAAIFGLLTVRGDAALDELAVRRLDVSEESVGAPQERPRLHLARRGQKPPDAPLEPVVRVLGSGAFELDLDDARARPIRERRTEVIEEDLELRDTSGARKRERREKTLTGEGRERRYRRPVGPDRFATREDRLPHTGSDRILDRDWIRETLISQQRYVPVEVTDRSSTDAPANECIALVRD